MIHPPRVLLQKVAIQFSMYPSFFKGIITKHQFMIYLVSQLPPKYDGITSTPPVHRIQASQHPIDLSKAAARRIKSTKPSPPRLSSIPQRQLRARPPKPLKLSHAHVRTATSPNTAVGRNTCHGQFALGSRIASPNVSAVKPSCSNKHDERLADSRSKEPRIVHQKVGRDVAREV